MNAIRLVLDPSLSDARRILRPEDICEVADGRFEQGAEVRVCVELQDFESDPVAKSVLDGCIVSTDPYTARLTYVFRPLLEVAAVNSGEAKSRNLTADDYEFVVFGGADERSDVRRVRRLVSLAVLPALRDAVHDLGNVARSPLTELVEYLPPDSEAVRKAADAIDAATDELTTDKNVARLANRIDKQITRMVGPQLDVEATLGVAPRRPEQLIRSLRLFVDGARSRSISDTSTGNANVIYLALLLERLIIRRDAEKTVETLLAVEEPEAHLHPGVQRHLFGYLLRRGVNLILTTHSLNIAAVAPLSAIVLLHQVEGHSVAHTAVGADLANYQVADLERYLDVTRAEVLFARFVILVEGTAELYLIPALAQAAQFDLDAWGVVVTSVGGTDFVPYRRVLGVAGFSIPHVVISDGDRSVRPRYLGIRRAVKLVPEAAASELRDGVLALRKQEDVEKEQYLVALAAQYDVFLGKETLEVDLIPLLADEMVSSYQELPTSSTWSDRLSTAITAIKAARGNGDDKQTVLDAIDRVGKGRFSQRLAAHVAALGQDELAQRVGRLAGGASKDQSDEQTGGAGKAQWSMQTLSLGLHVLSALDRASRCTRGHGLLEEARA